MEGNFDLNSAIEQIQNMMNTNDGQAKLNNIINAFMGEDEAPGGKTDSADSAMPDIDQMDLMIKLGSVMSAVKEQKNSQSANLLYAIKPYLRKSRRDKTDGAIKIMGMVKAFALLKDSGINLNF